MKRRGAGGEDGRDPPFRVLEAPIEPEEDERKLLPPELPLFFMLSHLEDDGLVRLDGVKLGVCEVMGLEIDEPKLGAFAGALNALDFAAQLLVRQHPPSLDGLRENLREARPTDLPTQTRAAAESLDRLLTDLENRDGILDRRFYAVCEFGRTDELRGMLARAGLSVHPLRGQSASGCSSSPLLSAALRRTSTGTKKSRWRSTAATIRIGKNVSSAPCT